MNMACVKNAVGNILFVNKELIALLESDGWFQVRKGQSSAISPSYETRDRNGDGKAKR